MNKYTILTYIFFSITTFLQGQDTVRVIYLDSVPAVEEYAPAEALQQYYFSGKKEIGIDVTGLLAQLTPFNTVKAPNNFVGFKFKKYARRYAFRLSFGFDISEFDDEDLNFFYLSAGYERRRILGKRFAYNSGWEGIFGVESSNSGIPFVGVNNFHGIDFNINDMVFVGIETQLRLTITDFAPNFKVVPPTAVFFNVRF